MIKEFIDMIRTALTLGFVFGIMALLLWALFDIRGFSYVVSMLLRTAFTQMIYFLQRLVR
jgi:hypothetical protein